MLSNLISKSSLEDSADSQICSIDESTNILNSEKGSITEIFVAHDVRERKEPEKKHYLKLLPLTILVFYNVAGGPVGIEPAVRAAGNLYAIIGFLVAPLLMSLPEALMTAELGSAFPHASGGIAWAEEAFGETMGLWCGYWNWISGATDNAIYPALFLDYLTAMIGHSTGLNGFTRFITLSFISIILAAFNYTGLEIVGNTSVVICILSMSPFVVMCIMGIPHIDPSKWLQLPSNEDIHIDEAAPDSTIQHSFLGIGGVMLWRDFLNNLFWNYNSFDSTASYSCEIRREELSTTYPRGIFYGLILATVCYVIPLLVATGVTNSTQSEWVNGHLESIAEEIGGKWLATWTIFAVAISNLGLFEAELSADSYQLMGMAEKGYVPKFIGKRSQKFGTPVNAIIVGTLVIVAMSVADFSELVAMLNFNYSLSLLVEYAAFVALRYKRNDGEC